MDAQQDRRHDRRKVEMDKVIVKEAIKEWMNEQFAALGRWTLYGLLTLAFGGLVWIALLGMGFKK